MGSEKISFKDLMESFLAYSPEIIRNRTIPDISLKSLNKTVIDKSLNDLFDEGKSLHEINKIYKNNILKSEKYE